MRDRRNNRNDSNSRGPNNRGDNRNERGGANRNSGPRRKKSTSSRGVRNGVPHRSKPRDNVNSFDSGNQRERITVESGQMVLIDQFMLANPEFTKEINRVIDGSQEEKNAVIKEFGGYLIELKPGVYRIDRNPYNMTIFVHLDTIPFKRDDYKIDEAESIGNVYIDTRCVAMIDRELLDDLGLLEKYQQLWFEEQTKACRDLLRDNGCAVRYGFSKSNDDLSIKLFNNTNVICLVPSGEVDAIEEM
jgi:hypothetical protein